MVHNPFWCRKTCPQGRAATRSGRRSNTGTGTRPRSSWAARYSRHRFPEAGCRPPIAGSVSGRCRRPRSCSPMPELLFALVSPPMMPTCCPSISTVCHRTVYAQPIHELHRYRMVPVQIPHLRQRRLAYLKRSAYALNRRPHQWCRAGRRTLARTLVRAAEQADLAIMNSYSLAIHPAGANGRSARTGLPLAAFRWNRVGCDVAF